MQKEYRTIHVMLWKGDDFFDRGSWTVIIKHLRIGTIATNTFNFLRFRRVSADTGFTEYFTMVTIKMSKGRLYVTFGGLYENKAIFYLEGKTTSA